MPTTITVTGPMAEARVQNESADYGNLRSKIGKDELAALAQNGVVGLCKVPPYCDIVGCHYFWDALGANTSLAFGTETQDGATAVAAAIKADAASTSAGAGYISFEAIDTGSTGMVITAKQGGVGTATGTVGVAPVYIHRGY